MISKLLSKIFGISSKPQAPKTFAQKKRSIFLNRYAGVIYFLVCWHVFGHLIIFGAKDKAKQEGIELHQLMSPGTNVKKIEIGKDFSFKIVEIPK